jgi:hypothetical protein
MCYHPVMTWREDLILAVAGTFGMVGYVAGEFNGT